MNAMDGDARVALEISTNIVHVQTHKSINTSANKNVSMMTSIIGYGKKLHNDSRTQCRGQQESPQIRVHFMKCRVSIR